MLQENQCFFEGKTERSVLEALKLLPPLQKKKADRKKEQDDQSNEEDIGGKDNINKRIKDLLGPNFGGEKVRCLIMRDLDSHDKEDESTIKQGVVDCFRGIFQERGYDPKDFSLTPHEAFPNVFVFASTIPDVRVALHIAEYKYAEQFKNSTIDDYLLNLAVRSETTQQFIKKKKENRRKAFFDAMTGDDEIEKINKIAEAIIKKVLEEFPRLLQENNFPSMREAKQYLHIYSVVTQEFTPLTVIAKDIVRRATDKDKEEVLASLLAAIQFISTES